jgi:5-methylcytosine-specific restriction endonuclease McrA
MEGLRQRRPRLALTPEEYAQLKANVLDRDAWACRYCGLKMNLHVHHLKRRRDLGSDAADNLSASRFELYCPEREVFSRAAPVLT